MRIRLADFKRVHIRAGETVWVALELRPDARTVVYDHDDPYQAPVCRRHGYKPFPSKQSNFTKKRFVIIEKPVFAPTIFPPPLL